MIDLKNDLTLHFAWLIHNFELGFVDMKFRLLPTMGTTVQTGLSDWIEQSVPIHSDAPEYASVIGKSKDEVWTIILGEWTKFVNEEPFYEGLRPMFEYVQAIGIK